MLRRLLVIGLILAGSFTGADEANCNHNQGYIPVPFAHETIDVSTTAKTLTANTYAPSACALNGACAVQAFITGDTADVRFCLDGTVPTSSTCHPGPTGFSLMICEAGLAKFQAIREDAADAKLRVTYYRKPPVS